MVFLSVKKVSHPMPDFILEIGVEEVPAGFAEQGRRNLARLATTKLSEMYFGDTSSGEVSVFSTPRRLVLKIVGLPSTSLEQKEKHKGPPIRIAYDDDGKPTKALEGFAKRLKLSVDELEKDGEYVFAETVSPGCNIRELIQGMVPQILDELPWPKSMKWDATQKTFVRPVRWITAFLDNDPLDLNWAGVQSGNTSVLRRPVGEDVVGSVSLSGFSKYESELEAVGVMMDQEKRTQIIREETQKIAKSLGGEPVLLDGDGTYRYLADHVEKPIVLTGEFDDAFLAVPREVLELTMWQHQKYIPLVKGDKLLPRFIITANRSFGSTGPESDTTFEKNVLAGNRRVLSARLSDAQYFWQADQDKKLIERLDDLKAVTFQKDAGSIFDRVERIKEIAVKIASAMGVDNESQVRRAAELAKADLTTKMVFEFPELQGVVGRRLTEAEGEDSDISAAIEEHYWPLGGGAELPTDLSAVIALADKLDLLSSIFGVGLEPTGSKDPYALRRAAIGIVRILKESGENLSVQDLITTTGRPEEAVTEFVHVRSLHVAVDEMKTAGVSGVNMEVADAVAFACRGNIPEFYRRLPAAASLTKRSDYEDIKTSFKRVKNIQKPSEADLGSLWDGVELEAAEQKLVDKTDELQKLITENLEQQNYDAVLNAIANMRPEVDNFFDAVLVNDPDENIRKRRHAMLQRLARIFDQFMDFSKL